MYGQSNVLDAGPIFVVTDYIAREGHFILITWNDLKDRSATLPNPEDTKMFQERPWDVVMEC